ncbi:MAG TPA: carbohydrate ABC transporter permease [Anaerolineae bacterium]|nr:carbohydrate ABC transporter permease [Anaerolineae bacterium]
MKGNDRYRYRRIRNRLFELIVTLTIVAFCLGPLFWVLSTSFKPMGTEYLIPPEFWPSKPSLQAYKVILGLGVPGEERVSDASFKGAELVEVSPHLQFIKPMRNSLIVSAAVSVFALLVAALAAYAISRLRFKWKIQSLMLLWVGGLLPAVMVIAPTFVLMRNLGLLRTLPSMILPNIAYNIPLATWLLAVYFSQLPWELEDAAKVDGYKPLQIFWKVVLPLSAPGLFSAGVFAFLGSWGEFMLASVVTMGVAEVQTVPVAILNLSFEYRYQWTWISAAIILSVGLMVLIALVFQRWVIQGLTAGSVKY